MGNPGTVQWAAKIALDLDYVNRGRQVRCRLDRRHEAGITECRRAGRTWGLNSLQATFPESPGAAVQGIWAASSSDSRSSIQGRAFHSSRIMGPGMEWRLLFETGRISSFDNEKSSGQALGADMYQVDSRLNSSVLPRDHCSGAGTRLYGGSVVIG